MGKASVYGPPTRRVTENIPTRSVGPRSQSLAPRSHAPRGDARLKRSASARWARRRSMVRRRGASRKTFRRGAWEREAKALLLVPTLRVGTRVLNALRPLDGQGVGLWSADAERHRKHSDAERGNEKPKPCSSCSSFPRSAWGRASW